MSKPKKVIPLDKAKQLEDTIGWLSDYLHEENEYHFVVNEKGKTLFKETSLLRKLGKINMERKKILKELLNKPH